MYGVCFCVYIKYIIDFCRCKPPGSYVRLKEEKFTLNKHEMMKLKQNTNLSGKKKDYVTPKLEKILVEIESGDCIPDSVYVKNAKHNSQKADIQKKNTAIHTDFVD